MIEVIKYSEKSVAAFGEETKTVKDDLRVKFNGKFNFFLKRPDTGATSPGWIFSIKYEKELREFLKGVKQKVTPVSGKKKSAKQKNK